MSVVHTGRFRRHCIFLGSLGCWPGAFRLPLVACLSVIIVMMFIVLLLVFFTAASSAITFRISVLCRRADMVCARGHVPCSGQAEWAGVGCRLVAGGLLLGGRAGIVALGSLGVGHQ